MNKALLIINSIIQLSQHNLVYWIKLWFNPFF